jgi:hypothetical protein
MDPSSETTHAKYCIQSSTSSEQLGQLHQKKIKKRGRWNVCMCENIENWATVARPLHVECLKSNVSGADCYNVFAMVAFSRKARQALAY